MKRKRKIVQQILKGKIYFLIFIVLLSFCSNTLIQGVKKVPDRFLNLM